MTQDTLAKQLDYLLLQLWEAGEKIEKLQADLVESNPKQPVKEVAE